MDSPDRSALVTRREFYSAIGLVWLYIMLAFGQVVTSWRPGIVVLFVGAFVMSMVYLVLSIRSRATK